MGFSAVCIFICHCLVSLALLCFLDFTFNMIRVAILLAIVIYAAAAKVIWNKREHLDGFLNPLNESPFINTVTTEVTITTEERPVVENSKYDREIVRTIEESATPGVDNPYSVNIQVSQQTEIIRPLPSALRMRSLTRQIAKHEANAEAWLYARVAFLFFIALLITWVCPGPSLKSTIKY